MSDRELLEDAAKAAGHRIVEWATDGNGVEIAIIVRSDGDGFSKRPWQPMHENQMTDADGDALRLAVRLRIDLLLWIYTDSVLAQTSIGVGRGIPLQGEYVRPVNDHKEPKGNDPLAATRRAIVRAAAEIGRSKE